MAVTLETIARKLGVSKVTVSLALRGSQRISAEIRAKVLKAAEELGYAPNPMVSALMVSLHAHRRAGRVFNLCFLTSFPTREGWKKMVVFHRYHAGALRRAETLGYGLEIHWARDPGLSGPRLTQILEARGIPGILIAPLASDAPRLALDWSRFATVAFVDLDWIPERGDIAAIDQRPGQIGEAAVDLLVEQINQNRRGGPAVPRTVLIEGVWRDGPTLPVRG